MEEELNQDVSPDTEETEEVVESEDASTDTDEESSDESEVSEDTEDDESPDDEYTDDPEAWLGQYRERGLPDGIKSPEDLAAAYLATLPEMKKGQTASQRVQQIDAALKARGITGGVDALLSGNYELQPSRTDRLDTEQEQTFFNTTAGRATLNEMEKNGLFRGEYGQQTKEGYEVVADFIDKAYGTQFKKAEQVYTTLAKNIISMQEQMRDYSWAQFNHPQKKKVEKAALDSLMNDIPGINSYAQAMNWYLLNAKPELIAQLAQEQQKIGEEKGLRKFKGKFKTGIKGKPAPVNSSIWKGYISDDGTVNDAKLNRLPIEEQLKILQAYEKKTGRRL